MASNGDERKQTFPVHTLRTQLRDVMDRVEFHKETVVVTRNGRVIAEIVPAVQQRAA